MNLDSHRTLVSLTSERTREDGKRRDLVNVRFLGAKLTESGRDGNVGAAKLSDYQLTSHAQAVRLPSGYRRWCETE